jgi:signal transduction histidine kinase
MLFVALYVVNRNFSRRIWFPFNTTLEKLKSLNLTDRQEIQFSKTGINEFDELNSSLEKMTARLKDEFNKVKQFTENASHEIQTPLSIIRSKIETLIQTENISEVQMNSIQQINDAVTRLSRLNNALITLTKIENHQFGGAEEILLNKFIQNKLLLFEDVLQQKNISVTTNIDTEMKIKMNTSLADLLFENLISNAIKHNIDGGFINISFLENQFSISNSGNPLNVSPDLLFNRFVKNNPASDSLGLGLAMVKQICASYNFDVSFSSAENLHSIKITF